MKVSVGAVVIQTFGRLEELIIVQALVREACRSFTAPMMPNSCC
jgi:hypothetical protein